MKINRSHFLHCLETVAPGLAKRESIEQSTCFVFKDGQVMTFNDEVSCRRDLDIGITGAVVAEKLMQILARMTEEEVNIAAEDGHLVVKGKRRRAGVCMEANVTLPIASVDVPEKWRALEEEFCDAVKIVLQCASTDASSPFNLICVHIYPDYLEACDNFQMTRFPIKTGVKKPTLVKREAIQHITSMGMTEVAVTKAWLHYRNPDGLVIACRRGADDFFDMEDVLQLKGGDKVTLPGGLADAVAKAEVFSADNSEANNVRIDLKPDKLKIKSTATSGFYEEFKDIKYSGVGLSFLIAPKLLTEICKRHNECEVTADKLRIDTGRFVYVACLLPPVEET